MRVGGEGWRIAALAIAIGLAATPACAHPHVWVTVKSKIAFTPEGKVSAVIHDWVCVEDRGVAVLRDGRPAPRNTASRNLYYPMCFRDSSEIRRPAPTVPSPACRHCALDATPAVRRPTAPAVRRGRSR